MQLCSKQILVNLGSFYKHKYKARELSIFKFFVKDWVKFTLSGSIFLIPITFKKFLPKIVYARSIGLTPFKEER